MWNSKVSGCAKYRGEYMMGSVVMLATAENREAVHACAAGSSATPPPVVRYLTFSNATCTDPSDGQTPRTTTVPTLAVSRMA
ncbi:hypothetical protein DIPPA_34265 [Diplonema papillatum]|nr:hypothetical protein DIPPA_34265 [Diplonema papillatum]